MGGLGLVDLRLFAGGRDHVFGCEVTGSSHS